MISNKLIYQSVLLIDGGLIAWFTRLKVFALDITQLVIFIVRVDVDVNIIKE